MDLSTAARRRLALDIFAVGAVYCVAAGIGLEMAFASSQVSVVWPASGIALALLVLRGTRVWPAITIGALAAQYLNGAPLSAAVGIAAGSTLEALLGATLLARAQFAPALTRVRDVAALVLLAAALSPIVGATIGVSALCFTGTEPWNSFALLWSLWWVGDAVGVLIVAPVMLIWANQLRRGPQIARLGEALVLAGILLLLSLEVFIRAGNDPGYPLHYLIFPAIIWSALRLGQHATATLIASAFFVTVIATLAQRGPFVGRSMNASLLDVEAFFCVLAVTGFFLGAATAERNRAERRHMADYARLRRSEQRLSLALAAGHMGAWEWDIASGKVEWSDELAAMHGLKPGQFRGTLNAVTELMHPEDRERVLEAMQHSVANASEFSMEFRNIWPDGTVHWVAASARVIHEKGEPVRMVGVCRDITEHKAINDALTRQAQQLAEADRRKDDFLAVLGHELRNPLAPLQNSVALLARRASDPSVVAHVRTVMQRQIQHLVRLVDDLLDVSRIRSGKIVLLRQRIELAVALNHAIEISRPGIEARNHHLTISLPQTPIWLDADPTRLPQLLANLLNNAAKYTAEGGQITVSASCVDGEAVIRVRDNGIGMTADELEDVFELFAQAGGADKHAVQGGLGVGLSLAKSLAELHGGSLCAFSEGPQRGSEFVLRLPSAAAPVSASAVENEKPRVERAPGTYRILVVDDNVDAAESLGLLLSQEGHDVQVAHSGVEALRIARNFIPDIMILDLGMPEMDGYAVAREVRSSPELSRTRLIALSGYGQAEDRRRTAAAGFAAHLVKPIELDQLIAALPAPDPHDLREMAT